MHELAQPLCHFHRGRRGSSRTSTVAQVRRAPEVQLRFDLPVLIERVEAAKLPPDWRELSARAELQQIGAMWAHKRASAVLGLPCAVVPAETGYLVNPSHPDFARITLGARDEWETDPRLLRSAAQNDF
ncbi:RES family NAD+ phosphorylase [Caballeronia grimmiae]|uniref:RES family NAD+ phosphorylase n=1 Tax=Caballeronia grimmiae TaxID=1071679 RepID=UPI0038B87E49